MLLSLMASMGKVAGDMSREEANRKTLWVLVSTLAFALSIAVPGAAFADVGTQLGLRVTDSLQDQGSGTGGQPGATQLGIRVTDSASSAPLVVKVVLDPSNGSDVEVREVPYNTQLSAPADPRREGYAFLGWFTAPSGGSLYEFGTPVVDSLALYAQWTLLISCDVPSAALLTINSSGSVTGESQSFASSTVVPLKVSAIECVVLDGASKIFADQSDLNGTQVTLTPPESAGSKVQVPLVIGINTVKADFVIPKLDLLSIEFGLSVPPDAKLSYSEDACEVVRLGYELTPVLS